MTRVWIIPLLLIGVLLCACGAPVSSFLVSEPGRAKEDHFEVDYRVWLPPGYETSVDETYPLLVWFHGGSEDEFGWGRKGRIGELAQIRVQGGLLKPFVVVSPSAGGFTPIYRAYERILIEQVLPDVRESYRVTDVTVAFGHSMGGLSVLSLSFRHPDLFDAIVVASPFVFDTYPWDTPAEKKRYDSKYGSKFLSQWRLELRQQFDTPEDFDPWNPFNLARENATKIDFPILLTSGNVDPFGLYPHNVLLHEHLEDFGVEHEWYVQKGVGHGTVEDPLIMKWLNDKSHPATKN